MPCEILPAVNRRRHPVSPFDRSLI